MPINSIQISIYMQKFSFYCVFKDLEQK
jgi:hypothetical protein